MTRVRTPRIEPPEAALMLEKLEAGYAIRYISGFFGRGDIETCRALAVAATNKGGDLLIGLVNRRIEGLRRRSQGRRGAPRPALWRAARMTRTRKSAKQAGSRFERMTSDFIGGALGDDGVDRQVKNGSKDLGDVRGVKLCGLPVVIECKDYGGKNELPQWYREAEAERANKGAAFGVVVWKRKGTAKPAEQHVSMTLGTFVDILKAANGGTIGD